MRNQRLPAAIHTILGIGRFALEAICVSNDSMTVRRWFSAWSDHRWYSE
jgi:hypothetical protein